MLDNLLSSVPTLSVKHALYPVAVPIDFWLGVDASVVFSSIQETEWKDGCTLLPLLSWHFNQLRKPLIGALVMR